MLPVVAIVGRPNVGKSSIFNAIIGERKAIVHNMPGVTRDRIYEIAEIDNKNFLVIDTGGFILDENEPLEVQVKKQALMAIEEADIILVVFDIKAGLTPIDKELFDFIRKKEKKFFILLNKADSKDDDKLASEFYELGEEDFLLISAIKKRGFSDFYAKLLNHLPEYSVETDKEYIKVGILGRPNVGKSSLVNKILGYERVIVSDIPGTTRDSVDSYFQYRGRDFLLIDTAGIRRKSKISYKLEKISVLRSITTIERSDVLLLLLDATEGITHQDKALSHLIDTRGKGIIILFNKWDIIKEKKIDEKRYNSLVKKDLQFLNYAPVIKISALTGLNVKKVLNKVMSIYENQNNRIPTSQMNKFLEFIKSKYSPPTYRGKQVKINYITQVLTAPPKFIIFCNFPEGVKDSYKKYIKNQIREYFNFEGIPIKLEFRRK